MFRDRGQPAMRWPACAELILGVYFGPGGRGTPLRRRQHVGIMFGLQPDTGALRQVTERAGGHLAQLFLATGLALPLCAASVPPIFSQLPLVTYFQALPW